MRRCREEKRKEREKKRPRRRGRGGRGRSTFFLFLLVAFFPPFRPARFCLSLCLSLIPSPSWDSLSLCHSIDRINNRYEKYVNATDGGRGGPGDGGRDAFGEAHSLLLGKLAALQTRCDEAAAASDRAVRAGINADIR